MKNLIVIKKDVFSISKRLKAIDKKYIVFRNLTNHCFEVHYGKVGNKQLVVPYDSLDYRTIQYVLKTKIDDISKLIESIDKYNENIKKENMSKVLEKLNF